MSDNPDHKKTEASCALNIYLYVIMDVLLNIKDGRFVSALYEYSPKRQSTVGRQVAEKTIFIFDMLEMLHVFRPITVQ